MKFGPLSCLLFVSASIVSAQTAINTTWQPVTAEERALKSPSVDKDAGVEALFWQVHVMDDVHGSDLERTYYHYVRLKVFNDNGKSQVSTIEIPIDNNSTIDYLYGRTTRPDGTQVELTKDSIFTRDLVRAGARREKVKSFAMPGVEPGAIVEYRWKETHNHPDVFYTRLQFQREYPVQSVTYYVKPLNAEFTPLTMSFQAFHCQPALAKPDRNGFNAIHLEHMPAFHEEPMMPGAPNVRRWGLIFYSQNKTRDTQRYWNDTGKELFNRDLKPALHLNDEIKQAALKATEDAKTDDEKTVALIRYIRTHMRNLYGDDVSDTDRQRILKNQPKDRLRTSVEVCKSGIGSDDELNTLLVAMASQAGLQARPALVGNRNDLAFDPSFANDYFLRSIDTAINIDGKWKLYDVTARFNPPGMLTSGEEGMKALIGDAKQPVFVDSPVSAPELSHTARNGKFTLTENGVLEGDIEEALTGHAAADQRSSMRKESEARRLDLLKERITKVFPEADVSAVKLTDFDDADKPLKIGYHIKLEGYGQRTGKRLLFQPLYFERADPAVFTANDRQYPILFPYAWSETDNLVINLPAGFNLDNAQNQPRMEFGKPGSYRVRLATNKEHQLFCERELTFGKDGMIYFPKESYLALKKAFDEIHNQDNQTVSLIAGDTK